MNSTDVPHALRVSLLVPTFKRIADLERCLSAALVQDVPFHEIVVITRLDDAASIAFVDRLATDHAGSAATLKRVSVSVPGVIAAMQAGLDAASPEADVIALTDDDGAPRADWCARIVAMLSRQPDWVGVGGRDWQWYDGKVNDGRQAVVGRLQWFGRVIGNHHLGIGPLREVDILKGANSAFRAPAFRETGFDRRLHGAGAQVHWELSLCLQLRRFGKLVYDPALAVDHYPATRADNDVNHRGGFHGPSLADAVHNETLVLLEHFALPNRLAFALWSLLVGTGEVPGAAQVVRGLLRRRKFVFPRWCWAMRGRLQGWGSYRKIRRLSRVV